MDVVGADRHVAGKLALVPSRDLIGVRHDAIGVVPSRASVADRLAGRELRRQRRAHLIGNHRAVDQERIGREIAVAWSRIEVVQRETAVERGREHGPRVDASDQLEVRLVEEPAVATANDADSVDVVGQADARLEVVLVDRIVAGAPEERVVDLVDRNDLEVVTQAQAERQPVIELPFVLRKRGEVIRLVEAAAFSRDANREALGIRPRIGRIEGDVIQAEAERAVQPVLGVVARLRVLPLHADLEVMVALLVWQEPRQVSSTWTASLTRACAVPFCWSV